MKKFLPLIFVFLAARLFSQNIKPISFSSYAFCPAGIKNFMACYPDIKYSATFDRYAKDWRIELTTDLYFKRRAKPKTKKNATFYWAGGRLLPKEELANKEIYWVLQYEYENKLRDPKTYTAEEIEKNKTIWLCRKSQK